MLEEIKGLPGNVVGIHAVGDVTKDDYDKVLIPKLEEISKKKDKIRYLLVLDTDVSNFSLAAWWSDLKLGIKHYTDFDKIAVVTDEKGVKWFTDIFEHFIPGNSRGFPLAKVEEAKKWITE